MPNIHQVAEIAIYDMKTKVMSCKIVTGLKRKAIKMLKNTTVVIGNPQEHNMHLRDTGKESLKSKRPVCSPPEVCE